MSDTTMYTKGPSDGWFLVASAADNVSIKSNSDGFWYVAVADIKPAADFVGERYTGLSVKQIIGLSGKVYVRAATTHTHAVTVGTGIGSGGTANTAITSWPHTLATHTATGVGTAYNFPSGRSQIQVSSDASHTGTSTVDIEGSNDNVIWKPMGTLTVTGNSDTASLPTDTPWAYIRSNCTAHGDSANDVITTLNV